MIYANGHNYKAMRFDEQSATWLLVKNALEQQRNDLLNELASFGINERDADYIRGKIAQIDITINDLEHELLASN